MSYDTVSSNPAPALGVTLWVVTKRYLGQGGFSVILLCHLTSVSGESQSKGCHFEWKGWSRYWTGNIMNIKIKSTIRQPVSVKHTMERDDKNTDLPLNLYFELTSGGTECDSVIIFNRVSILFRGLLTFFVVSVSCQTIRLLKDHWERMLIKKSFTLWGAMIETFKQTILLSSVFSMN